MAVVAPPGAGGPPHREDPRLVSAWARPELLASLRVVVDAVVGNVGFETATVAVRFGAEEFRVVAHAGHADSPTATEELPLSTGRLEAAFAAGRGWGSLCFTPDTRSLPGSAAEGEWQPNDGLYAPFRDPDGVLVGVLSVTRPTDGRRPDEATRTRLASMSYLAERAVLEALAAGRARDRNRASAAARTVVRRASEHLDVAGVLSAVLTAVVDEFDAAGSWARLRPQDRLHASDDWEFVHSIPDWLVVELMASGLRCWEDQRVLEVAAPLPPADLVARTAYAFLLEGLADVGLDSLLQVPLGAGEEFLGYLIIARTAGAPRWSEEEREEALSLGHDIGNALLKARTFEREQELVEQLKRVDDFKRDLVSTFSHELRTPLTSLGSHLELLEMDLDDERVADAPLAAMRRAVNRLQDLVEDLILLSRLIDPDRMLELADVDLGHLVEESTRDLWVLAKERPAELQVRLPAEPVFVRADPLALERAVGTLLGDLVRFPTNGGRTDVAVRVADGEAQIVVSETGEGAASAARARLFGDLLHDVDQGQADLAGHRLDLRITERIVARHGGRIELEQGPDSRSNLVIHLPLPDRP